MTERDSLTKFNAAAKEFAAQHVAEIARDLNQWQDTGLLPDECKLRELDLLCFKISPFTSMRLAESIANRACRDAAALAQPVAAEPSIDDRKDAERYRWLRSRLPGAAYRIAGVIYSEGGAGVDAAIDAARAPTPA